VCVIAQSNSDSASQLSASILALVLLFFPIAAGDRLQSLASGRPHIAPGAEIFFAGSGWLPVLPPIPVLGQ